MRSLRDASVCSTNCICISDLPLFAVKTHLVYSYLTTQCFKLANCKGRNGQVTGCYLWTRAEAS